MSEIVGGIVKKIFEKKLARGVIYNICLEEDDGSENWYGYGRDKPDFGEGSEIEFEVNYNGDFANVNTKTVEVINLVEPQQRQQRGGNRGGGRGQQGGSRGGRGDSGGSRNAGGGAGGQRSVGRSTPSKGGSDDKMSKEEWAIKDRVIQWQSCRNSAIAVLELAIAADALPLPAKKADKLDALVGAVNELTEQFFLENTTLPEAAHKGSKGKPSRGSSAPDDGYDDGEPPFDDDGLPGDE